MAISQYRPSSDPFDRLFENLLGSTGGYNRGGSLMRAPATDVIENETGIRVVAELPGLTSDDIELDLENNVLTIRGEKSEERTEGDEQQGTYHLAERRYGTFSRSFVLPRDVDPDGIQAQFDNGVLTIQIPKSEKARRRRIEIGGGNAQSREVSVQGNKEEKGGKKQKN